MSKQAAESPEGTSLGPENPAAPSSCMLLGKISGLYTESARLKSQAMRPILTICGSIWASGMMLMLWGDGWIPVFGAIQFAVGTLAAVGAFFYFAFTDPDRLGSEGYVERTQTRKLRQSRDQRALGSKKPPLLAEALGEAKEYTSADGRP